MSALLAGVLLATGAVVSGSSAWPAAAAACTIDQPLRWGMAGERVRCLEQALVDVGYTMTPDDFFGFSTGVVVRSFQAARGFTVDGIVGPETAGALGIWADGGAPVVGRGADTSVIQEITFGTSVQGRPLVAIERGTPGGVPVMVIGVIHGDEDDGARIVDKLRSLPVPPGVDLWLVPTMNPDGTALNQRQNAHGVDLNRNFPRNWGPIGGPGNWQYAGTGPASEPETAAMVDLLTRVNPLITIWYHQDLDEVAPGGHDSTIYKTYAQIVTQKIEQPSGGTYTGTATQFNNSLRADGTAFVVELPGRVPGTMVYRHAAAVLSVAKL